MITWLYISVINWSLSQNIHAQGLASSRQTSAEMNEMYGMSTSEGTRISQDNSVQNYYPDLYLVIQVWSSYPNVSLDMQV